MNILKKLIKHLSLTGSKGIIRRYFVTNAFDGILTTLGIVVGSYYINVKDPKTVLAAGLGGAVAIAMSGISSAYLSEKAEKLRKIKNLEKAMLMPLRSTILAEASKTSVFMASLVNGISPFTGALIPLSPFALAKMNLIPFNAMYPVSITLCLSLLFSLGVYMGVISKENKLIYGIKTLSVGIIVTLVLLFLRFI